MDEETRRALALEDAETESIETLSAGAEIFDALVNASLIYIYSAGLTYVSVCAPREMTGAEVTLATNYKHATGIESAWALSDDLTFQHGETNPCACNDHPTERLHWLLGC